MFFFFLSGLLNTDSLWDESFLFILGDAEAIVHAFSENDVLPSMVAIVGHPEKIRKVYFSHGCRFRDSLPLSWTEVLGKDPLDGRLG